MKNYFMNIIGAVLISAFSKVMLPPGWDKYINIITGLIITVAIISPLGKIEIPAPEILAKESEKIEEDAINLQREMIKDELAKRIEEDISTRIRDEFGLSVKAEVSIQINDENEIEGVRSISVSGTEKNDKITARLNEIYAPREEITYEY